MKKSGWRESTSEQIQMGDETEFCNISQIDVSRSTVKQWWRRCSYRGRAFHKVLGNLKLSECTGTLWEQADLMPQRGLTQRRHRGSLACPGCPSHVRDGNCLTSVPGSCCQGGRWQMRGRGTGQKGTRAGEDIRACAPCDGGHVCQGQQE